MGTRDILMDSRWETSYAAKRRIQLLLNGDLGLHLYRQHQPEFFAFVVYGTDNLAHKFWKYYRPRDFGISEEEAAPFADALTGYYREADRILGEFLELLPQDTTVAVVSDHGFGSAEEAREATVDLETKPRMEPLVRLAGIQDQVSVSSVATRGYVTPFGDARASTTLTKYFLGFLDGVRSPDNDLPVFFGRPIANGMIEVSVRHDAPPLGLLSTPAGPVELTELVEIEERAGSHSPEGILLLRGPGVRANHTVPEMHLEDLCPTLLHLAGIPFADDMDGRVLLDCLLPESLPFRRAVSSYDHLLPRRDHDFAEEDPEMLESQLRQLGYLR